MSHFKKTCFNCGCKVNELKEGLCENCFSKNFTPIKNIKPLNIKFCNMCNKIHVNNALIKREELEKRMPNLVKKNLELNKGYTLKNLEIINFEIEKDKVNFEIEVDCDIK